MERAGEISLATSLRKFDGRLSGPAALWCFKLQSSWDTLSEWIWVGGILGRGLPSKMDTLLVSS